MEISGAYPLYGHMIGHIIGTIMGLFWEYHGTIRFMGILCEYPL